MYPHSSPMESKEEIANKKIQWSSETNWNVAHGSLKASVAVDSFEDPIEEPVPDSTTPKHPVVLKPPLGPVSNPCEIKIRFEQKYEINQVYVRSTARTYEVYYMRSPQSGDEYLCTIRCGIAERDEKVLQVACYEDGSEEREESLSGDSCVSSEEDWVKIKDPEDDMKAHRVNIIQDYYEATAQISDVDPCSVLTIRLLSLQNKSAIYVDEVYIFASQVQSTITKNEEALAGSSAQNSLMAMFVPAFLQLSKSNASRVQDKSAPDELLKDDKTESRLGRPGHCESGENQVNNQYPKPAELDKNATDTSSVMRHAPENICSEHATVSHLPPGHLERALEQLASRTSRVEDICLRFEEKLLKPIENMEARLQQLELQLVKLADNSDNSSSSHWTQISEDICLRFEEKLLKPIEKMEARLQHVEVQLEKLSQSSNDYSFAHGKIFSAPIFSCSESNLSSSYDQGTPYPPYGTSEIAKTDFSCDNLPGLACEDPTPGLVITAPEFSHVEDDEFNGDLKLSDNHSNTNQKKTSSVDDALAAALFGFLSTAKTQIEASLGPSESVEQEVDSREFYESDQNKEVYGTEKGKRESLPYTPILMVKAPDFISEDTSDANQLSDAKSALEMDSIFPRGHEERVNENAPSLITNAELYARESSESIYDSEPATEGNFLMVSGDVKSIDLGYEKPKEYSEPHKMDCSVETDAAYNPTDTVTNSAPKLTKDLSETDQQQIYDELERIDDRDIPLLQVSYYDSVNDVSDKDSTLERCFKEDNLDKSHSPRASLLDIEFPILEVKFSSDMSETTSKATPLETLLDGMSRLNLDASPITVTADEDFSREDSNAFFTTEVDETKDFVQSNGLLLDLGDFDEDGSTHSGGDSHTVIRTSSLGLTLSLI